jgi:hypothetical protein
MPHPRSTTKKRFRGSRGSGSPRSGLTDDARGQPSSPPWRSQSRWWAVRVQYEALINDVPNGVFEDVIFVVLGRSGAEAEAKGTEFAVNANHEYENPFGEMVVVRFDQVTDVHETRGASIEDGTRVHMSQEAGSEADSLKERGRTGPRKRPRRSSVLHGAVYV